MRKDRRKELNDRLRHAVAIALKNYRESNDITKEQMARNLYMSFRSYVDLENGISAPSAVTLSHF